MSLEEEPKQNVENNSFVFVENDSLLIGSTHRKFQLASEQTATAPATYRLSYVPEQHWQVDKESTHCPSCSQEFKLWNRRHHCRCCCLVYDDDCAPIRSFFGTASTSHTTSQHTSHTTTPVTSSSAVPMFPSPAATTNNNNNSNKSVDVVGAAADAGTTTTAVAASQEIKRYNTFDDMNVIRSQPWHHRLLLEVSQESFFLVDHHVCTSS
jgi:hypothetical protein